MIGRGAEARVNALDDTGLQQLLVRIADGDGVAMQTLFDRERPSLFRFFYRLCRRPDQCEDLLQGTFLNLWRYRSSFKNADSASAYIYKVALNEWKQNYGREKRHQTLVVESAGRNGAHAEPEDRATASERKEAVWRAVELLPEAQQQVFLLHRLQNLNCREIAEATGESVKTIESRLRLALIKLTQALKAHKDEA